MFYILDENKKPIQTEDYLLWGRWFEGGLDSKRRVGFADINGTSVSTVFVGIDMGFGENHVPVLWETMCFSSDNDYNEYTERYTSHEDALKGHEYCVDMVTKKQPLIDRKPLKIKL